MTGGLIGLLMKLIGRASMKWKGNKNSVSEEATKVYFKMEEFRCKCGCGGLIVDGTLIDKLNKAREIYGKPMIVNSGYRCKKHNKAVGGHPNSPHMAGGAADIKCDNSRDRFLMTEAFFKVGFLRIGIGKTFLHVDVSKARSQRVIWDY